MNFSLFSRTVLLALAGYASGASAQLLPVDGLPFTVSNVVKTPHVQAELVVRAPGGFMPGSEFQVGLLLTPEPGWHTYWKNPGDSGMPTQLTWNLPPGMPVGPVQWPAPEKIDLGPLLNYGYSTPVLLSADGEVAYRANMDPESPVEIQLSAEWVVCNVECIPQSGTFKLDLPAGVATVMAPQEFEAAKRSLPSKIELPDAVAIFKDGRLQVSFPGLPAELQGKQLALIPETQGLLKNHLEPGEMTQKWVGKTWFAEMPWLSSEEVPVASTVLVQRKDGTGPAWRVNLAPTAAAEKEASATDGLLGLLFGAFLGGLLLNLMPCVFPVLALKVVGFVSHGDDVKAQRDAGMAYTAGVLLTFLLLGGLLLALRALGAQLGWGFQLQNPWLVTAMVALFALSGLNLMGVFETRMILPQRLAALRSQQPMLDSFISGGLAVAVASPCTAPFMAASLGVGLTLPAYESMWLFAAMGLGMSSPFLLAAWLPQVTRFMPKPGPWMESFKRVMGLPLLLTATWLLWVISTLAGVEASMLVLAGLVSIVFLINAMGRKTRPALSGEVWCALVGVLLVVVATLLVGPGNSKKAEIEAAWKPWSADAVAAALEDGRPVFVDFTASWCITCQYNKKTVLADSRVLQAFKDKDVVLLRADWTKQDPEITKVLATLGRSGVPVYVLYHPGREAAVLREMPAPDDIISVLK